jgi:predicted metal-dependent hydrolase
LNSKEAEEILQDILRRYDLEDKKKLGKELLRRLGLKCETSKPWSKFVQDVEGLIVRKLREDEKRKLKDLYNRKCNPAPEERP